MKTATIRSTRPRRWRAAGSAALVAAVIGVSAVPAHADDDHGHVNVTQTNLVANRDGYGASIVDPSLVNAWGLSKRPTSPVWVSNNHSDNSTLYRGGSAADPASVVKQGLTVTVEGGPTGQVANLTTGFNLSDGQPALFIFATEAGEIRAWNQGLGTVAERAARIDGANFKGLAIGSVGTSTYLYAADFVGGAIDVFDSTFTQVNWTGAFHVPHLPKGFSPFNVQALTDASGTQHIFVAYAKVDPATGDEIAGQGLGMVAEFTTDGQLVRRYTSHSLNAPWGLAYAPASWGRAAGDLLVGQFGNGRIEMFSTSTGKHTGTVRDDHGHKLVIDGLWGLMAGDSTSGGDGTILFTAGPDDENDGLYGVLTFVDRQHHDD